MILPAIIITVIMGIFMWPLISVWYAIERDKKESE